MHAARLAGAAGAHASRVAAPPPPFLPQREALFAALDACLCTAEEQVGQAFPATRAPARCSSRAFRPAGWRGCLLASLTPPPHRRLPQAAAEALSPAGFVQWPGVELVEVTDSESEPESESGAEEQAAPARPAKAAARKAQAAAAAAQPAPRKRSRRA